MGLASPSQQEQVGAATCVTGLVDEYVERQRGEVIGDGVDAIVFFLHEELQIAVAGVATMQLYRAV